MPRDKNPSLSRTCLLCRQKMGNQLKLNCDLNLNLNSVKNKGTRFKGKRDEMNDGRDGDGGDPFSQIAKWKSLCLETFTMLFGLPVNHPFVTVFDNGQSCNGHKGQMCNRCLQDVSNVQFVFWQLQNLEKKLSELQILIFDRLRSNYEALPVGLVFGKFMGVEELTKDLDTLKYDEVVKILFEEIKSKRGDWPKPSITARWTEAVKNSAKLSQCFHPEPARVDAEEGYHLPGTTSVPSEWLPSQDPPTQVKIEVEPEPGFFSSPEDANEQDPKGPVTVPITTEHLPDPLPKRIPKKNPRFKINYEEEPEGDEDKLPVGNEDPSTIYQPVGGLSDPEPDDEWIANKPKPSKKSRKKVLNKICKKKEGGAKMFANARFLCTEDPENCTKTYGTNKHLKSHIESFHKARKIACSEAGCTSKFKSEHSLTLHLQRSHDFARPKEMCGLCGLSIDPKDMRKHFYLRHHGIGTFKCDLCSLDFHEESDFLHHSNLHTTSEYPFSCVICPQIFTNSMDLKSHVTSNHLRSGLKCSICGIMKPNDFLLQRHLKIHDRVKRFKCLDCNKAFSTQAYLRYHQDHHHLNETRRFPCEICGKEFKHEKNVMRHLVSHQEEKPFKCKICSKTFNYSHLLKKHEEIHSGTKNYECHLCGKRFKQDQNLRQHMKSHRPKPERSSPSGSGGHTSKRNLKMEGEEEDGVEEISYEIHQDEMDKDAIPVILQVKSDHLGLGGGGVSSHSIHHHHHQFLTATTTTTTEEGTGFNEGDVGGDVIEATIIPAQDLTEDGGVVGVGGGQYEHVQEIQLHHSQDLNQSQTATVVFLYEYNA